MGSAVPAPLNHIDETGVYEWSASRLAALIPEKERPVDAHPEFFLLGSLCNLFDFKNCVTKLVS